MHQAGYLHCDIKPDNITIGQDEKNKDQTMRVRLIDFGISQKYIDQNGKHLPNKKLSVFTGSLWFTSANVMGLSQPSRRDDLISLAYLMLYMINELPQQRMLADNQSFDSRYNDLLKAKRQHCPYTLSSTPRAMMLADFFKEIWSYDFDSDPAYGKLRHLLAVRLIDLGQLPNKDIFSSKGISQARTQILDENDDSCEEEEKDDVPDERNR